MQRLKVILCGLAIVTFLCGLTVGMAQAQILDGAVVKAKASGTIYVFEDDFAKLSKDKGKIKGLILVFTAVDGVAQNSCGGSDYMVDVYVDDDSKDKENDCTLLTSEDVEVAFATCGSGEETGIFGVFFADEVDGTTYLDEFAGNLTVKTKKDEFKSFKSKGCVVFQTAADGMVVSLQADSIIGDEVAFGSKCKFSGKVVSNLSKLGCVLPSAE